MDTGAAFTGGAGNDTFNADTTTLGSLDVLDGGAGTDTLSVKDSAAITSLGSATISGIETLTLNSTAGSVGSLATSAGTAVAQVATITVGTPSATSQKYDIQIGDQVYTTSQVGGSATKSDADTVIKAVLNAHLADGITITNTTAGTIVITSNVAGSPLPTIATAIAASTSTATGTISTAATTANVLATGTTASKQSQTITITSGTISTSDTHTVSVGGRDYSAASSGASVVTAATDIAALINTALGAGTASSAQGVVTVTSLVAGTPLPVINVATSASSPFTDTHAQVSANRTVDAISTTATAVSAPTATTSATVTAGAGVVNVSVPATSTLSVTKGTSVQTSGGTDVTVTGATGSLSVTGATGVINVTTTNPSTTSTKVASNVGTGQTATTGTGIYVTGGTTVTVKQNGATTTSTSTSSTAYTNTIQVGVDPTGAKDVGSSPFAGAVKSPTSTAYFNAVGGLAANPTGDVTVNAFNNYTVGSGSTANAAGKSSVAYAAATQNVFTNGATTVSLTGVGTGTVTDVKTTFVASSATDTTGAVAGASKLATVNLTGISGTTTIKSDAISTVSVKDATGSAAVSVSNSGTTGVNAGAFNLNVGNSTVTVTNATTTSVNVGSTAATTYATINGSAPVLNSSTLTLNATKATSLNLTNANSLTLATGTAGLAKVATITASGAGNLTADVSSATDYAKLVTVDASAASGKVTLTVAPTSSFADSGQVIKTGAGADKVTLAGSIGSTTATAGGLVTTTVDLGAGNDALVKGTSGAIAAGAGVDGGAGTDTIDATLITIGNSALIKNFERLDLRGATDGGVFDSSVLANSTLDGVKLNGALSATSANTYGVTNLAGTTITADIVADTAAQVTTTLAASTGTSDVLNANFASSTTLSGTPAINTVTSITATGLTSTGIETVNIASGGTTVNPVNFFDTLIANKLKNYTDNSNKTTSVVVTGAREVTLGDIVVSRDSTTKTTVDGVTLTFNGDFINQNATYKAAVAASSPTTIASADVQAALTTIDASATTGGANIWAGVSESFVLANASATGYSQIYDGLTIKGGSGSDMIRNSAKNGVTTGGDGKDWLIVDGTTGSADGGAGDDTLVANAGKGATLTGGTGNDTFDLTAAVMVASSTAALTEASTLRPVTITDFASGDILKFGPTTLASGVLVNGTAAVAAATSLFGAIDAALKATTSTTGITADVGTNVSVWFVYGGNTYIANETDNTGAGNGLTGDDIVVKLTGIHTLSAAAVTAAATGLFGEA